MANNTYFQYLSLNQLITKYREIFQMLEEGEGEITDELAIKLKETEDNFELLGWEVLQIIDTIVKQKKLNEERIKNLKAKNDSIDKQAEYLNGFMKTLVKEIGKVNPNANKNFKFGERSITVSKGVKYEVTDDFKDNRFIRYTLKDKLDPSHAKRIENFLKGKGEDPVMEKVILKAELNEVLKSGEIIDGIEEVKTETLIKK